MSFSVSDCRAAGCIVPQFDVEAVRAATVSAPVWLHFGAGNIFRAFVAAACQRAIDEGRADRGIIVCESYDPEILEKVYRPYDNECIAVSLKSDGTIEKTLVSSIADSVRVDPCEEADWQRLRAYFTAPSLQMVSFTVTEKGYAVLRPEADPMKPVSIMGRLAALLYARYTEGAAPLALVSMDNCSHNGDKLKIGVLAAAKAFGDEAFLGYLNEKVTFPLTMIDKITPRPDAGVHDMLLKDGFGDLPVFETEKHSFVAPFVNAEETEYLIIEDRFPNGRPDLETCGFYMTDRETVDKVERMKVCTCLNPLHTFLAVYGCVLGYTTIHDEMDDPDLVRLITRLGYEEGLPVVTDPGILSPADFLKTVLTVRLPNPFMPDTPQRIATDTSQKLAIRFGVTVTEYADRASALNVVPLAYAGWLRYLLAETDDGTPFTLSPDPELDAYADVIDALRKTRSASAAKPLLSDKALFGADLDACGLSEKVLTYLGEMLKGPGSVRRLLASL